MVNCSRDQVNQIYWCDYLSNLLIALSIHLYSFILHYIRRFTWCEWSREWRKMVAPARPGRASRGTTHKNAPVISHVGVFIHISALPLANTIRLLPFPILGGFDLTPSRVPPPYNTVHYGKALSHFFIPFFFLLAYCSVFIACFFGVWRWPGILRAQPCIIRFIRAVRIFTQLGARAGWTYICAPSFGAHAQAY